MTRKIFSGMAVFLAGICIVQQAVVPAVADEVADEAWNPTLAVGLDFTDGNSETMLGNVSLEAKRDFGDDRLGFLLEGSYGESKIENDDGTSEDETTAQNARNVLSYKRELNGMFAYADNTLLHDDLADIDYRDILGAGLGVFIVKSEENEFTLECGPGYLWEKTGGERDDFLVLRTAERWDWKISETSRIWESAEYIPTAEDFDEYLINAEIGAEAAMNSHMNLRVVLRDTYDSMPAPGTEKNDVALTASLVWKL